MNHRALRTALLLALAGQAACQNWEPPWSRGDVVLPPEQVTDAVPLGHAPGPSTETLAAEIRNPYEGRPESVREGEQLYHAMNCTGCHGWDAEGGMCPNLTDAYWRYGGTPAMVFKSISEGRPKGMPAFGKVLPEPEIWKLGAYIQSLGGARPPSAALPDSGQAMRMPKGRRPDDQVEQ